MDRIEVANDIGFRVGFSGYSGHLRVDPLSTVDRTNPVKSLPDLILPPAFPRETYDSIKEHIEEKHLLPRLDPDEFSVERAGKQWDFDWFARAKVSLEPSLPRTVIVPTWELPFRRKNKGSVEGIWDPSSVEVDVSALTVGDQDSGLLPRLPGPAKDFVRGSINKRPFRPGGLEESASLESFVPDGAINGEWVHELLNGGATQTTPPTLKQGLDLGDFKAYPRSFEVYQDKKELASSTPNEKLIALSVQFDDLFKKAWEEDLVTENKGDDNASAMHDTEVSNAKVIKIEEEARSEPGLSELDEILSVESVGLTSRSDGPSDHDGQPQKEGWALMGGIEGIEKKFHDLVPDMAINFPFELDVFQKEAIYHLEKGDSVFVSAHTSAGKTVVAEYAFALASKHCTRAVYTTPFKTISNKNSLIFAGSLMSVF